MNYGQIKHETLRLIFSDTSAGTPIADTYNNQADYVKAIPGLADDAQTYLATIKKIPAAVPLRELPMTLLGGCRVYTVPSDFWQMMAGGLVVPTGGIPTRSRDFRLIGGNRLFVPSGSDDWVLEYWRLPTRLGDDPDDSTPLDNTPDVQASAYENNIQCISLKVNGSAVRAGLLEDVRTAGKDSVCSCDDGHRYWLCGNGHAWLWDYELSTGSKPSWFYYTGIAALSFIREYDDIFHLNAGGRLTVFRRVFADYDGPIEKVYRFATQFFGGYDALKNVNSVIIAMRSDTNAQVRLTYITDYEQRDDLTTMKAMCWLLSPRNLAFRSLRGRGFAEVFRRRPMCRRVRHFTMRLENCRTGEDLSVVSAQIFYNYQGRQR